MYDRVRDWLIYVWMIAGVAFLTHAFQVAELVRSASGEGTNVVGLEYNASSTAINTAIAVSLLHLGGDFVPVVWVLREVPVRCHDRMILSLTALVVNVD